jgi:hypothetical protein
MQPKKSTEKISDIHHNDDELTNISKGFQAQEFRQMQNDPSACETILSETNSKFQNTTENDMTMLLELMNQPVRDSYFDIFDQLDKKLQGSFAF